MMMSVGTCECGCSEFGHSFGCPEELPEEQWDKWQKHRCGEHCEPRCHIQLCKNAGDGHWSWCDTCNVQCSGDYDSYSDEPEGSHDYDECLDEDCDLCNAGLPAPRNPDWPPGRGIEIQVNFTSESLTVSEWIIHKENGDLVRESSLPPNTLGEVPAVYAVDSTGQEILIQPEDLNRS